MRRNLIALGIVLFVAGCAGNEELEPAQRTGELEMTETTIKVSLTGSRRVPVSTRSLIGAACTASSDCKSGFCVDGVCCDTSCGGGASDDCLACSVAAGATANGSCVDLDSDVDALCRAVDNCPDWANPDQSDLDANGVGDACDPGTCAALAYELGTAVVPDPDAWAVRCAEAPSPTWALLDQAAWCAERVRLYWSWVFPTENPDPIVAQCLVADLVPDLAGAIVTAELSPRDQRVACHDMHERVARITETAACDSTAIELCEEPISGFAMLLDSYGCAARTRAAAATILGYPAPPWMLAACVLPADSAATVEENRAALEAIATECSSPYGLVNWCVDPELEQPPDWARVPPEGLIWGCGTTSVEESFDIDVDSRLERQIVRRKYEDEWIEISETADEKGVELSAGLTGATPGSSSGVKWFRKVTVKEAMRSAARYDHYIITYRYRVHLEVMSVIGRWLRDDCCEPPAGALGLDEFLDSLRALASDLRGEAGTARDKFRTFYVAIHQTPPCVHAVDYPGTAYRVEEDPESWSESTCHVAVQCTPGRPGEEPPDVYSDCPHDLSDELMDFAYCRPASPAPSPEPSGGD